MNHKQKLGYTLLGAGVMAVGITIGQFVSPNIEAQSNGVFDEITCRSLSVVDEKGETEIGLGEKTVVIRDKQGRLAVVLSSREVGNGLTVFDKGKIAGMLVSNKEENFVSISDKQGQKAVGLSSRKEVNAVIVSDKQGKEAVFLASTEGNNAIVVSDNRGKNAVRLSSGDLSSGDRRNEVSVLDKQGKAAVLLGNDYLRDTNYMLVLDNQGSNAVDLISTAGENGVAVYDKKSGKTGVRLYADERENGITVMDKAGNIKWITP